MEIPAVRWRLYLHYLNNLHQFCPYFERDFAPVEMVEVVKDNLISLKEEELENMVKNGRI